MKKQEKFYSEEQKEIRSFIKILLGLIIIFLILYFLSVKFVDKKEDIKRTNQEGKVQYESIALGTLLNRADDEYYVLVFDSENIDNAYIINKASLYKSTKDAKPIYTADLSLEFNKPFNAEKSSYEKDNIDNLKFSSTTLVHVKNHIIIKFIENPDKIATELSSKESN